MSDLLSDLLRSRTLPIAARSASKCLVRSILSNYATWTRPTTRLGRRIGMASTTMTARSGRRAAARRRESPCSIAHASGGLRRMALMIQRPQADRFDLHLGERRLRQPGEQRRKFAGSRDQYGISASLNLEASGQRRRRCGLPQGSPWPAMCNSWPAPNCGTSTPRSIRRRSAGSWRFTSRAQSA